MNPTQFEFTTKYLVHIAYNCFSNKYFETITPLTSIDLVTGKKSLQDNEYLLSIFKLNSFSLKDQTLFKNYVYSEQFAPKSKAPMELDPTKMTVWKEYFCRYDEGKKE